MNYSSKLIFILAGLMLFSCNIDDQLEADTLVNALIKVNINQLKTSSVTIEFDCFSMQDSLVVAYLITPPIRSDEVSYKTMTVLEKYDLIKEKGEKIEKVPYEFKGLNRQTDYFIGAMGLDKSGNVVTAPVIKDFTTPNLTMQVNLSYDETASGGYKFYAEFIPDISTVYYDYIFDTENADLSNEELLELLTSASPYVKREEGRKTFSFERPEKATAIVAAIPYDEAGVPGNIIVSFASSETMVTVDYKGAIIMDQPDPNKEIFETTFHASNAADFTITIDSEKYGFTPYSGNGGIGVTGLFSALPSFNLFNTPLTYSVSKSIGRMSKVSDGGENFFINTTSSVDVFVRVDMTNTDEIPRYYFEIVEENDPSVILYENFDLFAYSGDYMAPANGTEVSLTPDVIDGTEAGIKQAFNQTSGPNVNQVAWNRSVFDWPTYIPSEYGTKYLAAEEYIKNRGLEDWTIESCGERPGAIQLSVGGTLYGILTTPKFSAITGTSNIVLEIDMARFATSSKKQIAIDIIGGGQYTAGEVTVDGMPKKTLSVSGSQFLVNHDPDVCPPSVANDAVNKPVSHFKFNISGATSNTQIRIDTSYEGKIKDGSGQARAFIFEIKVTKQ